MKILERLSILSKLNKNKDYINKDLYRLLYQKELYILAYEKIKSKQSNAGLDGISLSAIDIIIEKIKNQTYKFSPATRVYIPKPGKIEKRPIDIANIKDKVVLESVRIILEIIFEPTFLETSHGFRPNKSCHTALKFVKQKFTGVRWMIEGDIRKYFNSIDHSILINKMEKKIQDTRFISLIRKILNAGYLEFKVLKTDLIGVPQGNIISPILSNIYLNELDKYIEDLKVNFDKGTKRAINPEYKNLYKSSNYFKSRNPSKAAELRKKMLRVKPTLANDPNFKKLAYVRYADDWIIGIIGSKKDAIEIKNRIKEYLKEKLKLELNEEKTLITNCKEKGSLFLGVDIKSPMYEKSKMTIRNRLGKIFKQRVGGSPIKMRLPQSRVIGKLSTALFCDKLGIAKPKLHWLGYTHDEIITAYNAVINGIFNYYSFVSNTRSLSRIYSILRSSAAKLLATKYKLKTQRKVYRKFGKILAQPNGKELIFRNNWEIRPMDFKENISTDISIIYTTRLTRSILNKICAICQSTEKVEMHHVKHLKNMNSKLTLMEKSMVSLNRKQIPVCRICHMDIHSGKYDGVSLKDIINKNQFE